MSERTVGPSPNHQSHSPWSTLLKVMTEPTAVFAALAERPALVPPYFLQTVTSLGGIMLMLPLTRLSIAGEYAKAPPPGMTLQVYEMIVIGAVMLGALAGPWLIGAILALVASFFG